MEITINNIDLSFRNGDLSSAKLYFNGKADTINVSGHIVLEGSEYDGKTYKELQEIVIQKTINKIQGAVE